MREHLPELLAGLLGALLVLIFTKRNPIAKRVVRKIGEEADTVLEEETEEALAEHSETVTSLEPVKSEIESADLDQLAEIANQTFGGTRGSD